MWLLVAYFCFMRSTTHLVAVVYVTCYSLLDMVTTCAELLEELLSADILLQTQFTKL